MAIGQLKTKEQVESLFHDKEQPAVIYCAASEDSAKAIEPIMNEWSSHTPASYFFLTLNDSSSRPAADELGIDDEVTRFLIIRDGRKIGSVHCSGPEEERQVKIAEDEIRGLFT